jgi:uncharacterized membrane protein YiaA
MTQLWEVTIMMLVFGAGVFSLGIWAAKKHESLNRPTSDAKK